MAPKKRPPRGKAKGHGWEKVKKQVFALHGTRCWLCGHGGSESVDHVETLSEAPEKAVDLQNLRPAHAYPRSCATCSSAAGSPVYCNEIRGVGSPERARKIISQRTGLTIGVSEDEAGEREW